MMIKDIGLPSGTTYDFGDKRVGNYIRSYSDAEVDEQSGTAITQTSAKYLVSDSEISSYVDGMVVIFTITASSDINYGAAFQINNLGWHPIIHGSDGMVSSSKYPVGTKVIMVYNASKSGVVYLTKNTATTVAGCWQIASISGGIEDAPSNNKYYARRNGTWGDVQSLIPTKLSELTNDLYSYGTADPSTIANPVEGQIYFKIS